MAKRTQTLTHSCHPVSTHGFSSGHGQAASCPVLPLRLIDRLRLNPYQLPDVSSIVPPPPRPSHNSKKTLRAKKKKKKKRKKMDGDEDKTSLCGVVVNSSDNEAHEASRVCGSSGHVDAHAESKRAEEDNEAGSSSSAARVDVELMRGYFEKYMPDERDSVILQFAGRDLEIMDIIGLSDPYFQLFRVDNPSGKSPRKVKVYQSKVIDDTLEPDWEPTQTLYLGKDLGAISAETCTAPTIQFRCFDKDLFTDDEMGFFTCSLQELLESSAQNNIKNTSGSGDRDPGSFVKGFTLRDRKDPNKTYGDIYCVRCDLTIHNIPSPSTEDIEEEAGDIVDAQELQEIEVELTPSKSGLSGAYDDISFVAPLRRLRRRQHNGPTTTSSFRMRRSIKSQKEIDAETASDKRRLRREREEFRQRAIATTIAREQQRRIEAEEDKRRLEQLQGVRQLHAERQQYEQELLRADGCNQRPLMFNTNGNPLRAMPHDYLATFTEEDEESTNIHHGGGGMSDRDQRREVEKEKEIREKKQIFIKKRRKQSQAVFEARQLAEKEMLWQRLDDDLAAGRHEAEQEHEALEMSRGLQREAHRIRDQKRDIILGLRLKQKQISTLEHKLYGRVNTRNETEAELFGKRLAIKVKRWRESALRMSRELGAEKIELWGQVQHVILTDLRNNLREARQQEQMERIARATTEIRNAYVGNAQNYRAALGARQQEEWERNNAFYCDVRPSNDNAGSGESSPRSPTDTDRTNTTSTHSSTYQFQTTHRWDRQITLPPDPWNVPPADTNDDGGGSGGNAKRGLIWTAEREDEKKNGGTPKTPPAPLVLAKVMRREKKQSDENMFQTSSGSNKKAFNHLQDDSSEDDDDERNNHDSRRPWNQPEFYDSNTTNRTKKKKLVVRRQKADDDEKKITTSSSSPTSNNVMKKHTTTGTTKLPRKQSIIQPHDHINSHILKKDMHYLCIEAEEIDRDLYKADTTLAKLVI